MALFGVLLFLVTSVGGAAAQLGTLPPPLPTPTPLPLPLDEVSQTVDETVGEISGICLALGLEGAECAQSEVCAALGLPDTACQCIDLSSGTPSSAECHPDGANDVPPCTPGVHECLPVSHPVQEDAPSHPDPCAATTSPAVSGWLPPQVGTVTRELPQEPIVTNPEECCAPIVITPPWERHDVRWFVEAGGTLTGGGVGGGPVNPADLDVVGYLPSTTTPSPSVPSPTPPSSVPPPPPV
ncbi:MAG TPA: hypothetical protein VI796_00350, partial [Candidatus Thermoplasmatota archaeon]|nr:hypothetical protein [Candidatus Thermoplasmatota archaeon]